MRHPPAAGGKRRGPLSSASGFRARVAQLRTGRLGRAGAALRVSLVLLLASRTNRARPCRPHGARFATSRRPLRRSHPQSHAASVDHTPLRSLALRGCARDRPVPPLVRLGRARSQRRGAARRRPAPLYGRRRAARRQSHTRHPALGRPCPTRRPGGRRTRTPKGLARAGRRGVKGEADGQGASTRPRPSPTRSGLRGRSPDGHWEWPCGAMRVKGGWALRRRGLWRETNFEPV